MPLHGIQNRFEYVEFDENLEALRLFDDTSSYEYHTAANTETKRVRI